MLLITKLLPSFGFFDFNINHNRIGELRFIAFTLTTVELKSTVFFTVTDTFGVFLLRKHKLAGGTVHHGEGFFAFHVNNFNNGTGQRNAVFFNLTFVGSLPADVPLCITQKP